ncbi:MAG: restriction endonuclease [Chloroflexota bacterium]|nr:restriction endonuclease [Chloroflexota bacterium]MDE2910823.1 restriction endonuclease [Chloroflexota bacterium]
MFELVSGADYAVIGEPATVEGARELAQDSANEGRYQFEWWALSLLRAKPVGGSAGSRKGKKGADQGIDGVINFFDEDEAGKKKPQKVVAQVKSGKVNSGQVQQLKGAMENAGAAIGVFITLENPTGAMTKEALAAGWYESQAWGKKYRRVQILTIGDLFAGAGVSMPPQHGTLARASRWKRGGVSEDGESQRDLI